MSEANDAEAAYTGRDLMGVIGARREARQIEDDLGVKRVVVNGTPYHIRRLTDEAFAALCEWKKRCPGYGPVKLAAKLWVLSVCDEKGELLYSPDEHVPV